MHVYAVHRLRPRADKGQCSVLGKFERRKDKNRILEAAKLKKNSVLGTGTVSSWNIRKEAWTDPNSDRCSCWPWTSTAIIKRMMYKFWLKIN